MQEHMEELRKEMFRQCCALRVPLSRAEGIVNHTLKRIEMNREKPNKRSLLWKSHRGGERIELAINDALSDTKVDPREAFGRYCTRQGLEPEEYALKRLPDKMGQRRFLFLQLKKEEKKPGKVGSASKKSKEAKLDEITPTQAQALMARVMAGGDEES